MKTLAHILESALRPIRKVVFVAIVAMFGLQVIVVFAQVVWREFFEPFSWSEELARYLQVWIVLLASSVCIREGSHLMVDYLVHYLSFTVQRFLKLLVVVLMMFFISVVIGYGFWMIAEPMMRGASSGRSAALDLPMWGIYLIFPIAGTLMWLESLVVFVNVWLARNEEEFKAAERPAL